MDETEKSELVAEANAKIEEISKQRDLFMTETVNLRGLTAILQSKLAATKSALEAATIELKKHETS